MFINVICLSLLIHSSSIAYGSGNTPWKHRRMDDFRAWRRDSQCQADGLSLTNRLGEDILETDYGNHGGKGNMSRLNELLHQAGSIGRNGDGSITRVGFSREYFQALELLKEKMEELGMRTETDLVGNLHGILPGTDPKAGIIAIGSHLDTVIRGGLYDGMLGVAGAIEAAARLREEGRRLRHSLEIWGFNMEESSVLGGTFGSRCVTGKIDPDVPGYKEKLEKFGLSPEIVRRSNWLKPKA